MKKNKDLNYYFSLLKEESYSVKDMVVVYGVITLLMVGIGEFLKWLI